MEIVITDGHTLNPGDLDWKDIHALGEVKYYDRTAKTETVSRCEKATVIITNKTPIDASVINAASQLKVIAVTATGYNIIDVAAARAKGVAVCNVPGYGTDSVAQHAIALLLELTNHVGENQRSVLQGEWSSATDWCYSKKPLIELSGKTFGVVGFGKIGQRTARIAEALGMTVIFHNPTPRASSFARQVSLEQLFKESDFVSLHCPLTSSNEGFVNKALLSGMKSSSFLINTSRGQLIQEADLAQALTNGVLKGAALDVLSTEPPPANHPLTSLPQCIITPHTAWLSFEARSRILNTTVENIKHFLAGSPQHVVS
ncbi:D-2-hydroxyacid dehydrogenase [Chryseolinea lacunae]|uniref:D-2-hydroxyacid dehydrogenase n=1 Tax=Chryseolinea lacunae TaxID=2801331 RepID=A0ABS1L1M2_9BACT|nr:D-2-hydroxyacid dehydrogenase [Chryseolinea lacunae]MBL0745433.1 D-2-hydroxyacid dehydrogenase [Chryseolinea lacunae]